MSPHHVFRELPTASIVDRDNGTSIDFPQDYLDLALLSSIREYGVLVSIVVVQIDDNHFQVVDGHRRYVAAKQLGLESIPCAVHQKLRPGDAAELQFDLQSTVKPWTQSEHATFRRNVRRIAA